ncbi:uncharacterized protein LTR77_008109 [Saxophila tyrrhenica]|uniref:Uncharacterized protein n=1 Tax=Saxophila tyrrhenica TaxID=1690608 RepID=A0AAV9P5N9_9PEZI|nr:hypothetical protein LTR77_008109 [Saxophila tyrrhenica]
MATTTSFTSLSLPAPDDTMEMSSPARQPLDDEDIDIDFDDYQPPADTNDDERMLEDDPTRPATANDEVMDDDVQQATDARQAQEELMQDDATQMYQQLAPEDEELIDYSEDEDLQDTAVEDAEIPNATKASEPTADAEQEDVDEEIERLTEADAGEEQPQALVPAHEAGSEAAQTIDLPPDEASAAPLEASAEAVVEPDTSAFTSGGQQDASYDESADFAVGAHDEEQPITVNTTFEAPADGPATPTDTGLHPMTLQYGDLHVPLFKSRKQLDGLLKDDNLANVSLADLMRSCRQRLPLKTDEAITDDQDLVLGFDQLALMLVEDSRAASSTSLDEVLQVYLQLHHNDGVEEVAPLSLVLSTQLKFTSSLSMFKQAVAGGQGMSSFNFLQAIGDGDHRNDQCVYEGNEDWTGLDHQEHGDEAERAFDGTTHFEQENAAEQDEEQVGEEQHYQDADQEYYFGEEGDYLAGDQSEAADALDGLAGDSTNEQYHTEDGLQGLQQYEDHEVPGEEEPEAVNLEHPGSSASSATIEGDWQAADITAGEYDEEELIDWDDECLTSDGSEPTDVGTGEDFTEIVDNTYDSVEAKTEQDNEQLFSSEDWLNEFEEPQDPNEAAEEGQQGFQHAGYEDGHEPQADQDDQTNHETTLQRDHHEEAGYSADDQHPADDQIGGGEYEAYSAIHEGLDEQGTYEHGAEHIDFFEDTGDHQDDEEEFDDTVLIHRQDEGDQEDIHQEGNNQQDDNQEGDNQGPQEDGLEDLGFDDDELVEQEYDAGKPATNGTAAIKPSGASPLGKRSFDEFDDLEDDNIELPEVKKVRSS